MLPDTTKLKVLLLVGVLVIALVAGIGTWKLKGVRTGGLVPPLKGSTALA